MGAGEILRSQWVKNFSRWRGVCLQNPPKHSSYIILCLDWPVWAGKCLQKARSPYKLANCPNGLGGIRLTKQKKRRRRFPPLHPFDNPIRRLNSNVLGPEGPFMDWHMHPSEVGISSYFKPFDKALPPVVDLFAGCGGMSLGFRGAGFQMLAGFDNWQCAVDTYNANLDHPCIKCDLGDFDATVKAMKPYFKTGAKPIIIGGPPCQDFSSAGKRKEGGRAGLTESYAQIVTHFSPEVFVMENVARAETSKAFARALEIFRAGGYEVERMVVDASFCGVPQRRKRLITVGAKTPGFAREFFASLVDGYSKTETTMRDWFGESLGVEHYYRHPRSYARRGVFSIDEPSPTIRGVNRPVPKGYPGHPGDSADASLARALTSAERASVQTFPKDFVFASTKTNNEQMIGNAVPVLLALHVAKTLAKCLKENGKPA